MKSTQTATLEKSKANVVELSQRSRQRGKSAKLAKLPQAATRSDSEVYLSPIKVDLYSFTQDYLRLLQQGDGTTNEHFANYFSTLLRIKLRNRMLRSHDVEDLQQDTLVRVLDAVRQNKIEQPERLGAYVNATCNNVLQEHYRNRVRSQHEDVDLMDLSDPKKDQASVFDQQEQKRAMRDVMAMLPVKDQDLLRAIFWEERDKDEICREFGVDRDYLRVLVHRAKISFKELYIERIASKNKNEKD